MESAAHAIQATPNMSDVRLNNPVQSSVSIPHHQRLAMPVSQMYPPKRGFRLQDKLPSTDAMIVYVLLVGVMGMTAALGLKGLGFTRLIFIAGCLIVAWRAWLVSPGLHIEVVITLLAFAPLLRRVVDLYAGYDDKGIMLIGPLLALCVALPELRFLLVRRHQNFNTYIPYGIMTACFLYGWSISTLQGEFISSTAELVKALVPMFYAVYLLQRDDDCEDIIQSAARIFLVISPIMGIYGVIQYLTPPEWDRYWMIYTQMTSIGLPEARQIRVFSTMNSPGSFSMFAACGLLLFGFCRRGVLPFLFAIPICVALLLTSIRTAWIVCAITVAYCFFFNATRNRATLIAVCLFGAGAGVVLLTSFGDIVGDRLATMGGNPAQDGSGHARLDEYIHVYSTLDQYLLGNGLGNKFPDLKMKHVDGQFIGSAVSMGIFVGNIHVLALIWAGIQGLLKTRANEGPLRLVAAGAVVGYLAVLPLLNVTSGEISVLFWLFVGILPMSPVTSSKMRCLLPSSRGSRIQST